MTAGRVDVEVRNYDGDVVNGLVNVLWPWDELPARGDVVTFGAPPQLVEVQWIRFELGVPRAVIVCERMAGGS